MRYAYTPDWLIAVVILVPPIVAGGVAVVAKQVRKRGHRLLLVGPSGAGKSTLSQVLRGVPPSATLPPKAGGSRHSIHLDERPSLLIVDLAGDVRLGAWKKALDDVRPHVTCLVLDQDGLQDESYFNSAERLATHLNDMGGGSRRAIVVNDKGAVEGPATTPRRRRDGRLTRALESDLLARGNLILPDAADRVRRTILDWF